jgi:AcrR family transcriptional regulator
MDAIRHGGPDLSIDDLASAAGVSKPVLYDEFGGKLGLADAIAVELAEQFERTVLAALAGAAVLDIDVAVRVAVRALIDLITDEPELYAFLVKSIRASDRGFLDNALVRVIHDRARVLVRLVAPDVDDDMLSVLTDGLFGFVFAAVESWHTAKRPPVDELADTLAAVIREGVRTAVDT